jgi:hypothetical protein
MKLAQPRCRKGTAHLPVLWAGDLVPLKQRKRPPPEDVRHRTSNIRYRMLRTYDVIYDMNIRYRMSWFKYGKRLIFRLIFLPNFRLIDLRVLGSGFWV